MTGHLVQVWRCLNTPGEAGAPLAARPDVGGKASDQLEFATFRPGGLQRGSKRLLSSSQWATRTGSPGSDAEDQRDVPPDFDGAMREVMQSLKEPCPDLRCTVLCICASALPFLVAFYSVWSLSVGFGVAVSPLV